MLRSSLIAASAVLLSTAAFAQNDASSKLRPVTSPVKDGGTYHLATDSGEQRDRSRTEPQRTKLMRGELENWLRVTGAKFPTPDPQFDPTRRADRWQRLKTNAMADLERRQREIERGLFQSSRNIY